MSGRPAGQVELPTNIEVLFKWMFDARMMAENKADLTLFTADHKIPLGFPVFVQGKENSSERGIYLCVDDINVSSLSSWELYGGDSVTVIDDLTTGGTQAALSAEQGVILKTFIDDINVLLSSDDTTLDEFQEVVNFIKANKQDLENLGISNIAGLQAALDGKLNDAPSDGSLFGRKNGTWTEIDLTIVANSIDNSMLAQMPEATLKGRASGAGVGNVQNLTKEQVKTILNYIASDLGIDTSSFLHSTATNLFELAEDYDLSIDQLFTDLSGKLDKGTYTGTAEDLDNDKADKYKRIIVSTSRNLLPSDNGNLLVIEDAVTLTFNGVLPSDFNFNFKCRASSSLVIDKGSFVLVDTEENSIDIATIDSFKYGTVYEIENGVFCVEAELI